MSTTQANNLLQWMLKEEDCDDDNRRFYISYLIAHTSLSMADAGDDTDFFDTMKLSLSKALETDQLSLDDKQGINQLWQEACSLPS